MITQFRVEYLTEEELGKAKVLQKPVVVLVSLEGEVKLCDALVALIKTKYTMVY